MRVLHCIGSLGLGGSQTVVMEIYRKINRDKIQFDFVVFPEEKKGFYDEVKQLGGNVYVCPRYNGKNHWEFCQWWHSFFATHNEYRIVHGHVRSVAIIYLQIAKKYGLKTIVHSHSTSNGSGKAAIIKAIMQWPLRYCADYLFACSTISGEWLYGRLATKKKNFYVVPNCIDVKRFAFDLSKREQIRTEYNISSSTLVVGHIGRFREVKNHRFLVDVFCEITKKRSDSILMLVGEGELQGKIREYCHKSGIADKVVFTGGQDNPVPFYSAMDVFVFPSFWEGVPLSVVEAQASGLHCVISDTITQDVQLTDLIEIMSLEKPAVSWAHSIIDKASSSHRMLNAGQIAGLLRFDSEKVVLGLEEFYQAIVS